MRRILVVLLGLLPMLVFSQDKKHKVEIYGVNNINIENSIYIDFDDPDFEIWSESESNLSLGVAYTYSLNEFIGIGLQWEVEKIKMEDFYLGDVEANRFAGGIHISSIYPATALHGAYGAFFNSGSVTSDDFDNNLTGIEYGVFLGPEYQISNFTIGLFFRGQFCSYYSKKEAPDAGVLMYPRITLNVGYSF